MLNNLQLTRLKLFHNEQFKKADTAGDLTGNKITNKITCVSKTSRENSSETVTNKYDKEIPKERYISPEKRQEIIDDLRLECQNIKKSQRFRKHHNKIVQKHLQIRIIKRHLKKDMYLQKKDRKLLII